MRLKLPLDVFLILFDLVAPLDILSIGQTCRTLREWSSIRFVWVKALRHVIKSDSLFEPVLNYKDENTPFQHLQHAATSPSCMLKLLKRKQGKPDEDRQLSPFSTTSIPFLDQNLYTNKQKLRSFEAYQKFFLVPGGRFIVVLSVSFSRLTVVDIDRYFDKKSEGKENPPLADYTASVGCTTSIVGELRANMSLNGDTLLVVVSNTIGPFTSTDTHGLTVWKYDPALHTLSLEKRTVIKARRLSTILSCHLTGNMFIFIMPRTLYIWDFINDKYVCWDGPFHGLARFKIFTDGPRIIILFRDGGAKIWNIPSLVSGPLINNTVPLVEWPPINAFMTAIPRIWRIKHVFRVETFPVTSLDGWFDRPEHPLVFDTLAYRFGKSHFEELLVRQQFHITRSGREEENPAFKKAYERVTYTHIQRLPKNYGMQFLESKMCENRVIRIVSLEEALHIMATGGYQRGPPKEPRSVAPNELVRLGDGRKEPDFSERNSDFDPCSGRLLQVSRDGSRILVYDYLRKPPFVDQGEDEGSSIE